MNLRFGIILTCLILLILAYQVPGQTVSGRIVNQIEEGLAYLNLTLYAGTDTYSTTTDTLGNFQFNIITGIQEDPLPN